MEGVPLRDRGCREGVGVHHPSPGDTLPWKNGLVRRRGGNNAVSWWKLVVSAIKHRGIREG